MRTWVLLLFCLVVVVAFAQAERERANRHDDRQVANNEGRGNNGNDKNNDKPRKKTSLKRNKKQGRKHESDPEKPRKKTLKGKKEKNGEQDNGERPRKPRPGRRQGPKKKQIQTKNEQKNTTEKKKNGKRKIKQRPGNENDSGSTKEARKIVQKSNEGCDGKCVETAEECDGRVVRKQQCPGVKVCCRQGKRGNAKKVIKEKGAKRFCKPLDPCTKLVGECNKKKSGCGAGQTMYKSTKKIQYCDKKSCVCCAKPCKQKKTCTTDGGTCQSTKGSCDGELKTKNSKGKKYCKGKTCACCIPAETVPHWSYSGSDGPAYWKKYYPMCGGTSQSPIDIVTANAIGPYPFQPFGFHHYDEVPTAMALTNNGHTAQVAATLTNPATIRGGDLGGEYTFLQFHLHWGSTDKQGSEHTVDGKQYPAELHLVHYKTEYGSAAEALLHPDGLAVLGIFLEVSSTKNTKLTKLITGLSSIVTAESETSITPFALEDLLPSNVDEFYRYTGSLTTPTCNEAVLWTVFKEPITISSDQLAAFRTLLDEKGNAMVDNFRPVQKLRGRTVYKGSLAPHWSYSGNIGPSNWATYFSLCGGTSQSPINIVTADAVGNYEWTHFNFQNYDAVPTSMVIINNGHTAQVTAEMASHATIQGGGLESEYTFLQFHFHWGSDDTKGSEHTVDGKQYPNELHLVHYKTSYGNVSEAIKHEDGLAVLGIFLEISASDNTNLSSIIKGLPKVKEPDTEASITPFALGGLLPGNVDEFYRYKGSLTTPTCNEAVTWTVFKEPITISASQMDTFRHLLDEEGHEIVDNFRPVQPLNGRTVYKGLESPHWTYEGTTGPSNWATYFPLCGGTSQSPINIVTANATGAYSWTHFNFHHYDAVPASMKITNNGHTAQVSANMSSPATVMGGELPAEYTFLQFHFHWGSDDTKGSEHTVDGKSYPNEVHLVHYKSSYGSVAEALKHSDGLAVLGIFLEISATDNTKLNSIISGLRQIHEAHSEVSITPFALQDLLPSNVDDFYRYQGSLTTPTCNEIVTWTVFKTPITISAAQMTEFRLLEDEMGHKIVNNFRPVQPLNGRTVSKGAASPHWTYTGSTGPSYWSKYFPLCGGSSQSPINIVTANTTGSYSWTHFNFHNYDVVPTNMSISNNGHTVQVSTVMTSPASVLGGELEGEYTFLQFHFHWGSNDTVGSEHTVDGKSYPNEVHLVHYKTSYGSVVEALKHADGLAVLGIFLEIGAADNTKLNSIINGLASVKEAATQASITPFALKDLLPTNTEEFYRYTGSLTTPTCNEIVTWTVFKEPITISAAQMAKFREVKDEAGHYIVDNFRPVQPLNGRLVQKGAFTPHWTYTGTTGPTSWSKYFPLCGGTSQSPINIVSSQTQGNYSWTHFGFKNYDAVPANMTIYNNGHTAQVSAVMTSPATVQGGNLVAKYTFLQFHFHWGSNDTVGSEHTVNGSSYPNEVHLVHYKTEYGNVSQALTKDDGLAVLGVFLKISASDNTKLNPIIAGLEKIKTSGATASITPFALQDLLPSDKDNFYRYKGSLTTPTCNEIVTWTVFNEAITISSAQMAKFRQLQDDTGHEIVDNFRPVQPLNGRTVYSGSTSPHWTYEGDDGPSYWSKYYPMCGGTKQSPINIVTTSVVNTTAMSKFTFTNYETAPTSMSIRNNGHSATVTVTTNSLPKVQGGNLSAEYTFAQFHFHWGSNASVGSEHTVDGSSYPNELHLVHFKSAYQNLSEAIKYADGLAVLGVMLKIDASDNTKLNSIITALDSIVDTDASASVTPFALQDLLPTNKNDFYRYQGSLTTPTCNEIVTWTVFKDPITISAAQMAKFRNLEDEVGHKMVDNFRPVQPLNGRTVYYAKLT